MKLREVTSAAEEEEDDYLNSLVMGVGTSRWPGLSDSRRVQRTQHAEVRSLMGRREFEKANAILGRLRMPTSPSGATPPSPV